GRLDRSAPHPNPPRRWPAPCDRGGRPLTQKEETSMNGKSILGIGMLLLAAALVPLGAEARQADPEMIKARQLFFGIENVDAKSGKVDDQQVIFSWITNASYAVSGTGR